MGIHKWEKRPAPQKGRDGAGAPFGVRLSPRNLWAAGAVLALAAGLYLWQVLLFRAAEEEPEGGLSAFLGYTGGFWALALGTAVLCLWEVRMPERARRAAGLGLLLLMPLGAFFAVDVINSTGSSPSACGRAWQLPVLPDGVHPVLRAVPPGVGRLPGGRGAVPGVWHRQLLCGAVPGPAHPPLGHPGVLHGGDCGRGLYLRAPAGP